MNIAVLVSGNGSNLQALLDSSVGPQVKLVLSNRAGAFALQRAEKAGVECKVFLPRKSESRDGYDQVLAEYLNSREIGLVVLAGWMRILGSRYLKFYRGDTINLHPALPGEYPGLKAIERAYRDKVARSGCMVHRVTEEVDVGEVLGTRTVELREGESLPEFEQRIHRAEHELLPEVVARLLAEV